MRTGLSAGAGAGAGADALLAGCSCCNADASLARTFVVACRPCAVGVLGSQFEASERASE